MCANLYSILHDQAFVCIEIYRFAIHLWSDSAIRWFHQDSPGPPKNHLGMVINTPGIETTERNTEALIRLKNTVYFQDWLVVDLPLWKIWVHQLGSLFPTEWKVIKFMFQTTNLQYYYSGSRNWHTCSRVNMTSLWLLWVLKLWRMPHVLFHDLYIYIISRSFGKCF